MNGFIYIMSNPSFSDNRIKIGRSKSDPKSLRKDKLYSTGVPEPFEVEYIAFVEDYRSVEIKIHTILDNKRPNKNREFFTSTIPEAILAIKQNSKVKFEEVFYKSPEEIENEKKRQNELKKQEEIQFKRNEEQARIKRNQSIERERLRKSNEIKRIHLEKITKLNNEKKNKIERDWYSSNEFKEINLEINTLQKKCYSLDLKLLFRNKLNEFDLLIFIVSLFFLTFSFFSIWGSIFFLERLIYRVNNYSSNDDLIGFFTFLFFSIVTLMTIYHYITDRSFLKHSYIYKPKLEVAEKIKSLEKLLVVKKNLFITSRKKISKILICKYCHTKNRINQKQLDNKKIFRPICSVCKNSLLIL